MILYKYYSYSAGISALQSSRLGFREPRSFNDPFELSFLDNAEGPEAKLDELEMKIQELKKSVATLSLTRNPLNPLMWAHYGENHTGFAIGYESNTPLLTKETHNLVPVDRGDVVYTNTKNLHKLNRKSRELLHQVYLRSQGLTEETPDRNDIENLARKIFLTKHSSWVYEEEIRVVKSHTSMFEESHKRAQDPLHNWDTLSIEIAPGNKIEKIAGLKIYRQPVRIKEVYLGARNPLINRSNPINTDNSLVEKSTNQKWKIFTAKVSKGSWNLERHNGSPYDLCLPSSQNTALITTLSKQEIALIKSNINSISPNDKIEITNWNGRLFLKKN